MHVLKLDLEIDMSKLKCLPLRRAQVKGLGKFAPFPELAFLGLSSLSSSSSSSSSLVVSHLFMCVHESMQSCVYVLSSAFVCAAGAFQVSRSKWWCDARRWEGSGSYLQLSKHHHGAFLTRIIIKLLLLLRLWSYLLSYLIYYSCMRAETLAKAIQGYDRAIIARFLPGGVVVVVFDRREGIAAKQKQRR